MRQVTVGASTFSWAAHGAPSGHHTDHQHTWHEIPRKPVVSASHTSISTDARHRRHCEPRSSSVACEVPGHASGDGNGDAGARSPRKHAQNVAFSSAVAAQMRCVVSRGACDRTQAAVESGSASMCPTTRSNYVDLAAFLTHCFTSEWSDSQCPAGGITFAVACNRHVVVPASVMRRDGLSAMVLTEPLTERTSRRGAENDTAEGHNDSGSSPRIRVRGESRTLRKPKRQQQRNTDIRK